MEFLINLSINLGFINPWCSGTLTPGVLWTLIILLTSQPTNQPFYYSAWAASTPDVWEQSTSGVLWTLIAYQLTHTLLTN